MCYINSSIKRAPQCVISPKYMLENLSVNKCNNVDVWYMGTKTYVHGSTQLLRVQDEEAMGTKTYVYI
jgi:hypothetical protein